MYLVTERYSRKSRERAEEKMRGRENNRMERERKGEE